MLIHFGRATAPFQVMLCALALLAFSNAGPAAAQEKETDKAAEATTDSKADVASDEKGDAEEKDAAEAEEKDPLAVPENASVEELFDFINNAKRNRGRTLQSVMKSAKAAAKAAQAIRDTEGVDIGDETRAIREQLSALGFLSRVDAESRKTMKSVVESLENDERPEIARLAKVEAFKMRISSAMAASEKKQREIIAELKELIGDDIDREDYMLASSLAQSIGRSKNTDVAASLYEDLATMMSESEDEMMRNRAPKMLGAARRIRLPGNIMQVMGTTADGETFDWDAYRGKVVLVDFWASWCGPCRAEVPNMKRNLEAYQDRGFEIVGVNLDQTLDACEKYVAKEELTWPNLISDQEGERGWDNPLATYYGITAIPTAILVDEDGKVVSLRARGKELDRLLAEMLGEPSEGADPDADDSASDEKADESESDA